MGSAIWMLGRLVAAHEAAWDEPVADDEEHQGPVGPIDDDEEHEGTAGPVDDDGQDSSTIVPITLGRQCAPEA